MSEKVNNEEDTSETVNDVSEVKPRKVFTEEDKSKYRKIFDIYDLNSDGKIEVSELEMVAKKLGYKLDKVQLLDILKVFNLDENGSLTFEEFLEGMPGNYDLIPLDEHKKAEFRQKFVEYDLDGDGFITRSEAYLVLSKELGFSDSQTAALMSEFDVNDDGKLSYEEFIGFYMKVKEKKDGVDSAFRQFDRGDKGYITAEDAKTILNKFGFTDDEVLSFVRMYDANKDGRLQYDEFGHFWGTM